MVISAFSFSMMAFVLKKLYLNSNISAYEVTYWQNIILIVLYYGMLRSLRQDFLKVPDDLRTSLIWLGFLGFMGISSYYLALAYIDLSKAAVLYWTNPMFTAIITYFWIRESISFIDWIAIACSFTGIILIQNPWSMKLIEEGKSREDMIIESLGALAALGGAIFVSISMMQTRKLGKRVHFLIPPIY